MWTAARRASALDGELTPFVYPDFTQELETAHVSALISASVCSSQNDMSLLRYMAVKRRVQERTTAAQEVC